MLVIQRDGGEERSAEEAPENMLQVVERQSHGGVLNSSLGGRVQPADYLPHERSLSMRREPTGENTKKASQSTAQLGSTQKAL